MNVMNVMSYDALAAYWSTPEIQANLVVFFNLLGAFLLGLFVGYERSFRGRAAGMRTYGLVCMASCALTAIAGYPEFWYGGHDTAIGNVDPGRIIQGVVTGIGFLGAGVIMRDGFNISGLTTAASIWTVSAIGVLVGVGFYGAAILISILAALFMWWGLRFENFLPSRHAIAITLHFQKNITPSEDDLNRIVLSHGYIIATGSFVIAKRTDQAEWRFVVVSLGKGKNTSLIELSHALANADGVESFHISHARN
ncbi:MAG TPA: MgtC/SapB family protein [Alphaproteobacteria bacterium]|nr:MgtC/SapB family protein [Alphaproteobacteria bacterium]